MENNELYHFGVKGMRWGIRRYQNSDGSLTAAGKKRYSDDINDAYNKMKDAKVNRKNAALEFNKAYNKYSMVMTDKNYKDMMSKNDSYVKAKDAYKKAKLDYKVKKADSEGKFDDDAKKSKHRTALEEKYKAKGYDDKQAAILANDRIRTEKILATAATLTVAACATYGANKYIKNRTDQIIKSGDLLQRIEMKNTDGKLNDVFYTSAGKHDNKRYEGLLGLTRKQQNGESYLMKLQATKDVKVASKQKAMKTFEDLYRNDPEFRKSVEEHVSSHFSGRNKVDINKLNNRNIKKMYDNFNSNLPFIRTYGSGADTKFYNKLKSAGYGAIQDINDMKFSGYHAKNPLIVFDNANNNIMVKSVKELTNESKMMKRGIAEAGKASVEIMVEKYSPYVTAGLAGTTAAMYVSDKTETTSTKRKK